MSDLKNSAVQAPVGVFDSGLGGLAVLQELRHLLPHEQFIYCADQANLPYGQRSLAEVRHFSRQITQFLHQAHQIKLLVIACNTASGAALHVLRQECPQLPFVGIEPAIKPAVAATRSGVVAVLATNATFQGNLFTKVVNAFAQHVQVLSQPAPELVQLVEAGELHSAETLAVLERLLQPLLAQGADTLVLGCTHYGFLKPAIHALCPHITIIDPAPAIARQAHRVLHQNQLLASGPVMPPPLFFTSAAPDHFAQQLVRLGWEVAADQVLAAPWL